MNDYKDGDISYNPNVPSYSAKYQLSNDDYNVKQLRKRYDIPTKKAPKLLIKGDGDLKGSSIGHKNLEFTFIENKKKTSILRIVLISNLLNRVNRSLK
ncbi:Csa1 family protein [Staphylococcus aureus]